MSVAVKPFWKRTHLSATPSRRMPKSCKRREASAMAGQGGLISAATTTQLCAVQTVHRWISLTQFPASSYSLGPSLFLLWSFEGIHCQQAQGGADLYFGGIDKLFLGRDRLLFVFLRLNKTSPEEERGKRRVLGPGSARGTEKLQRTQIATDRIFLHEESTLAIENRGDIRG